MNPEDENVLPFISELKNKITQLPLGGVPSFGAGLSEASGGGASGGGGGGGRGVSFGAGVDPHRPPGSAKSAGAPHMPKAVSSAVLDCLAALQMPFELKALEVCLESVRAQRGARGGDATRACAAPRGAPPGGRAAAARRPREPAAAGARRWQAPPPRPPTPAPALHRPHRPPPPPRSRAT